MATSYEGSASHNPYAPSSASLDADDVRRNANKGAGVWRDANTLVMLHDADLPDRCVKCNAPADLPTKLRRVYWHHWALYLLILVSILLYAIIALVVRKKAVVAPGLCAGHKARRAVGLAVGWTALLGGFALMVFGLAQAINPAFAALGLLLILVAVLVLTASTRIVYASRIDAGYVRLKGCKPAFLRTFPPFEK